MTAAPATIHALARTRMRRAIAKSEPPSSTVVPRELSVAAQRKAWPPLAPLGGPPDPPVGGWGGAGRRGERVSVDGRERDDHGGGERCRGERPEQQVAAA